MTSVPIHLPAVPGHAGLVYVLAGPRGIGAGGPPPVPAAAGCAGGDRLAVAASWPASSSSRWRELSTGLDHIVIDSGTAGTVLVEAPRRGLNTSTTLRWLLLSTSERLHARRGHRRGLALGASPRFPTELTERPAEGGRHPRPPPVEVGKEVLGPQMPAQGPRSEPPSMAAVSHLAHGRRRPSLLRDPLRPDATRTVRRLVAAGSPNSHAHR